MSDNLFTPVDKTAAVEAVAANRDADATRKTRIAAAVQTLKTEAAAGNKVAQAALALFKELSAEIKQ